MRILLFFLFISNAVIGQTNSEITYFEDEFGKNIVSKGPYKIETIKVNDRALYLRFTHKLRMEINYGLNLI